MCGAYRSVCFAQVTHIYQWAQLLDNLDCVLEAYIAPQAERLNPEHIPVSPACESCKVLGRPHRTLQEDAATWASRESVDAELEKIRSQPMASDGAKAEQGEVMLMN